MPKLSNNSVVNRSDFITKSFVLQYSPVYSNCNNSISAQNGYYAILYTYLYNDNYNSPVDHKHSYLYLGRGRSLNFRFWTFGLYRLPKVHLLLDPSNSFHSCWTIRTAVPERQNVNYVL